MFTDFVPLEVAVNTKRKAKNFNLVTKRNATIQQIGKAFGSLLEPSSALAVVGHPPGWASRGSSYTWPTNIVPIRSSLDSLRLV
ncbi:hypothetical protein M514_27984 [Trichuris suis]|uniref:Uncharacterized protein n=1 Tax=Trichuris suis TaxID=68888 RepID=A0A085MRK1_9BILA|nr:hypothetical protein M514_27984 [Trichuris suis]